MPDFGIPHPNYFGCVAPPCFHFEISAFNIYSNEISFNSFNHLSFFEIYSYLNGPRLYSGQITSYMYLWKIRFWKNVYCNINVDKIRRKGIFEMVYCPFKLPPS